MRLHYTDDPVADYDAYDAECQAWLESRPVCDICGNPIQQDHYFTICGKTICPDCVDDCKHYID